MRGQEKLCLEQLKIAKKVKNKNCLDNGGIKMQCLKYSNMLLQMFMFSFRSFPGDILGLKSISEEFFFANLIW